MYMLNNIGTVQILTEGTVEQLCKVSLKGILLFNFFVLVTCNQKTVS